MFNERESSRFEIKWNLSLVEEVADESVAELEASQRHRTINFFA